MKKLRILSMVLVLVLAGLMVSPAQAVTQAEINASIQKGLDWLVPQQNPDGSWGSYARVAHTGFAVVKLEERAFELGFKSPFDPAYQYSNQVTAGLNYLFSGAFAVGIDLQPAGDPDSEGDGSAIGFWGDGGQTYETGIAMMAIAGSKDPGRVVNVLDSVVDGWTYKRVLQNTVDYFAWGQNDSATGGARGGWVYEPNQGWSDNSNTGYAVLGLRYAEVFGCSIPAFLKTELNMWIDYIQNDVSGGSGYNEPNSIVNVLKTGNLLFQMAFVGDTTATPRVLAAIGYIQNTWDDPSGDPGWRPNHYQAMYCLMKSFQSLGIETITVMRGVVPTVVKWFDEFATAIVGSQNADGSWPPDWYGDSMLSTEWAILTLEKVAPPPPIVEGRMTGGGSVFMEDGTRVTHGFELHCNVTKGPNNLQVNWGKGNKFHLEKLTAASCSDDPDIAPNPPPAGFDTCTGAGTGRYKDVSGAKAKWTFTDAGEPGKNDSAKIEIWDANGALVLSVSGKLASGNHQAHAK